MPDPAGRAATGVRPPLVRRPALAVLILAAAGAAWLAHTALWRPLPLVGEAPRDGFTRLAGVVHVHTAHSDGGGTPEEVIAAAQAAGLDFVFLTDHNNLDAKPLEGYHGRLLVGVGSEVSTSSGHVLALGIDDPPFRFWGDVDAALDDVRVLGGVAFAAHPDSPRPDLRWTGWSAPGTWGLEAYNGDSQWRSAGLLRLLRTAAQYPAHPERALLGSLSSPRETLRRWDELLHARAVPMLAGADAHSRIGLRASDRDGAARPRGLALRFPSYAALFRLTRNHVLLDAPPSGDAARDLRRIVDALGRGRSYVTLDALAPGGGFTFEATAGERRFTMGDTAPPLPGLRLRAGGRVPAGAEVVLLHDGREITRAAGAVEHAVAAPGVYRAEVHAAGWPVPWALANPIYVFDGGAAEQRHRAAAWPEEAAPVPARLLDGFEDATIFSVEVDPSSSVAPPLVIGNDAVTGAVGPSGRGHGRVAFHLGVPQPGGPPHPWCALMSRVPRDLGGARGIVLTLKADGLYRLWVQVRDVNPRGSDDGLETWLTSVRTSTGWRRVAVPFERFRSLDPHSDGRLDLGQVRVLGLVLDGLTLKPGTRGTLYIDDLGVY